VKTHIFNAAEYSKFLTWRNHYSYVARKVLFTAIIILILSCLLHITFMV